MAARSLEAPRPVDPIQDHINYFFDRVVDCVNQRRVILLAEANEKVIEITARLKARREEEKQLLDAKTEIQQNITVNELRDLHERMLTNIERKLSEVRRFHPETRLKFKGESTYLEKLILALGKITEETAPIFSRYQLMEKTVVVGKKGNNPGELHTPHGVAVDNASNLIYVTEGSESARVSIFSERGEFWNSLSDSRMKCPTGIAFDWNNVYVTDTEVHGVFHFNVEADIHLVSALVGKGSSNGKFNWPTNLAVSVNRDLFIADHDNHRIQILNNSLGFIRSITHESLHDPEDVKLTSNEIYVLSSRDSPCLHVFSYAGDKLRSFITRGTWKQVYVAHFFCIDAEKNVIISDGLDHSIKVFSSNGNSLGSIRQFHDSDISMNPQGLALLSSKLVVVVPHDGFQLQIFQ